MFHGDLFGFGALLSRKDPRGNITLNFKLIILKAKAITFQHLPRGVKSYMNRVCSRAVKGASTYAAEPKAKAAAVI